MIDTSALVAILSAEDWRDTFLEAMEATDSRRTAYARAATLDEPLLCKGNDFIHTDIVVAGPASSSESE